MLNVAIIGLGKMGLSHFSIINANPNVNVVGVFLIFSLAFTNRPDVSPLLATMARSRLL